MVPYYSDGAVDIYLGDCRDTLRSLPSESVHCCVTSPPYWGLRDYGVSGQMGLERTPEEYVDGMVGEQGERWKQYGPARPQVPDGKNPNAGVPTFQPNRMPLPGLKPKDLVGIPWRVAFALQADGWWLRIDIIWHKPNPMPESVRDRPTKAHEYVFLFSRSERYAYDAQAISEPAERRVDDRPFGARDSGEHGQSRRVYRSGNKGRTYGGTVGDRPDDHLGRGIPWEGPTRNARSVWTIATHPYPGSHFATFPPALIKPMILAGCPSGGVVLDPFGGSGTTGYVAKELGRRAVLCELNEEYVKMAVARLPQEVLALS